MPKKSTPKIAHEKPGQKLKVIYHGERVGNSNIFQLFKDEKDNTYHFSVIKGVYVGQCYEVEKKPDGGHTISTRPKSVDNDGFELSDLDRTEAEAQKICVRSWRLQRRKDLELKKPHRDLIKAVELLKPFYRRLSFIDSKRLSEWLLNECTKKKSARR